MRYPHVKKNDFEDAWNKLNVNAIEILHSHYGAKFSTPWSQDVAPILAMLKLLPTKPTGKNVALMESLFTKAANKLIVFREVCLIVFNFGNSIVVYYIPNWIFASFQTNCALENWEETANHYPYIVAFGETKDNISHFYIEIEREFVDVIYFIILNTTRNNTKIYLFSQVPFDFKMGQVFELFFMLHKILKMNCDPNLERLFRFFEHYIFNIDDSGESDSKKKRKFKPTTAMQLLFDQPFENE